MSQHVYPSAYKGQPVNIVVGWDRPLQGYFLNVELTEVDGFVYTSCSDPQLIYSRGFAESLTPFNEKLDELGLSLPLAVIEQVELDAAANAGNRYVIYDQDGKIQSARA